MTDLLTRHRLLAAARADLLDRPDVELPAVPPHVAASWRRSLARGADPDVVAGRHHPDLDVGSRLVRCARPVMEQLAEQTAGVPVCVALTDDRARLLLRLDTASAIGRAADANHFAEGFGYDEGAAGTNGVGTVLASGGSVHIVGAEHFVERLQAYACAGAPVRDPVTGRVRGVLDVSCRAEHSSPILHSLVRSAAGRIRDALLADRDPGQQALFALYTRVDAHARRAVLAVGRRTVLANTALQTLLDPGDLAAVADHARFVMVRGADADEHLDLPSGVRVRMRGRAVTVGGSVVGLVAVLHGAASPRPTVADRGPLPEPSSTSPAWRAAWTTAADALRAGTPTVVVGERGSGRRTLVVELDRALRVGGPRPGDVVEVGPGDAVTGAVARIRRAGAAPLVVLRDVDGWEGDLSPRLLAAVRDTGARLAATATDTGRFGSAPLTRFRCSVSVPPLRNRSGDLPRLVTDLLAELAPGRDTRLSTDALRTLARHEWPGNVRELRQALGAALRRRPVGVVQAADLPASCQGGRGPLRPVDRAERDAIVAALRECGGNRVAAAAALGLARSTLYRKIAQYGLTG